MLQRSAQTSPGGRALIRTVRKINIFMAQRTPPSTMPEKSTATSKSSRPNWLFAILAVGLIYPIGAAQTNRLPSSPAPNPAAQETGPAQDDMRAAADRTLTEAEQLWAKGTADSRRQALEKYLAALHMFHQLGDQVAEANALNDIGAVYDSLGEKQKAREYYERALPLRRTSGDRKGEAVTLNNFGALYRSLGEMQNALDHYQQSLIITRSVGDRESEATTLSNLGTVYRALGEMQKALDVYVQALPIWIELKNKRGEAVTLSNLAGVYRSLGEPQKALEIYQESLARAREAKDRRVEGETLNNLGAVYRAMKDLGRSTQFFERSLEIRRAVGDRRGEAITINNLAGIAFSLADYPRSLELYQQSLVIWRALGDRTGEAQVLHNLGEASLSNRDPSNAIEYFHAALVIRRAIRDQVGEASTLFSLARLDRGAGRITEARRSVEEVLALVENLRTKVTSPDLRATYFASVQQYYEFYIALLMESHRQLPSAGNQVDAFQASERSRSRVLLDLLEEARADIRRGVDPQLLVREQSLQELLNAKADRQTRLLSGKHTPQEEADLERELTALADEYAQVQAKIRQASPRFAALSKPAKLSMIDLQTRVLDPETVLLEYKLGDDASYLWAVSPASVAGYVLPKRVEIEDAARSVYELLTERNRAPAAETPVQRQTRLRKAEAEYPAAAANLSRMILGPLGPLPGVKRLLVVSDGALQYIPFAALPDQMGRPGATRMPLVQRYEIVNLPSASVISEIRQDVARRKPSSQMLAVLADPVFDGGDPRVRSMGNLEATKETGTDLERTAGETGAAGGPIIVPRLLFSRQEARSILANVPSNQTLAALNFKASRKTATSAELGRYRYIHFATHGLLNSQHPELSGIVLSLVDENGQPQDGFLRLHEIYDMHLSADLVVLSACQTGLGKEIKGEGLIGLTRGFIYAGAPRVAASLWKVDDAATAELMSRFYRGMLKERKTPAAALRSAQIELSQLPAWKRSPYFWAAFVLQGEWN